MIGARLGAPTRPMFTSRDRSGRSARRGDRICGSACVGRHHPQRFAWQETKLEWGYERLLCCQRSAVRDTGMHAINPRDGGWCSGRIGSAA